LTGVCATSGILMLQATGLCHGTRAMACWVADLLLARLRAPDGCKRAWAHYEIQYKALCYLHITHTYRHTHTHTHTHSGLRNGPTYVALALWLNSPPCKWSGVEVEYLWYRLTRVVPDKVHRAVKSLCVA